MVFRRPARYVRFSVSDDAPSTVVVALGERSAQRIALEIAAPIIREARTWREVHDGLAREGIRFERKGSGAVLWIGQEAVKASSAGRDCSMSTREKRLRKVVVLMLFAGVAPLSQGGLTR